MTDPTRRRLVLTTLAITLIHLQIANSATVNMKNKPLSRPVHEVISEQNRPETKVRTGKAPILPYGNPLAGNSQQNARLHAQNQQAMFNAERVRQHRAQLQRWTKAPIQMDSYMKAYHESQENHQFALEQQQTKLKDGSQNQKQAPMLDSKRTKGLQAPELTKITKADAVTSDKARSHRSYGSDHRQYLASQLQSVYVSPAPAHDQGVTIKPHGNVGINQLQQQEDVIKLYTQAGPSSETQYIYPKQYNQMKQYQSSQEIEALNSLLKKEPQDQLSQLNVLLQSSNENSQENTKDSDIETPIDLYFYLKDTPSQQALTQNFEPIQYAQMTPNFPAYMAEPDHKPITEEIDDIADPNMYKKYTYSPKPTMQSTPERPQETTTTKSHNYYKVEVASQTITSAIKPVYSSKVKQPQHQEETKPMFQAIRYTQTPPPGYKEPEYAVSSPEETQPMFEAVRYTQNPPETYVSSQEDEDRQRYQAVRYEQPEPDTYVQRNPKYHQDLSQLYMHHNAQFKGVQHLSEDGSVTAYGDDSENVSNKSITKSETKTFKPIRNRRSNENAQLDTNAFLIPNTTVTDNVHLKNLDISTNDTVKAEALRLRFIRNRKPFGPHNTFLRTPEFPIGEAIDINTDYDYDISVTPQRPKNHKYDQYDKLEAYDDSEDDYGDYIADFSSPDDDLGLPVRNYHPVRTYAPNNAHYNQNIDLKTSFSNYRKTKRHPNLNALLNSANNLQSYGVPQQSYGIPQTSYGIPETSYGIPETSYGIPQDFGDTNQNTYGTSLKFGNQLSHGIQSEEPIYIMTETQLKKLVGHHNLNIEHLDVFQIAKERRRAPHGRPRKGHRGKRYPHGRPRNLKKNLYKLNRLLH